MFRFLHAADLHLDSPLKGLIRFDGAPVERIQSATRDAFRNLVDAALEHQVAFVLLAGDLWDGEWQDSGPGLFFLREVRRLNDAGIYIYAVKGNHDAASKITPLFPWPNHIHFFQHRKPHTVQVPGLDVFIHGQSYSEQNIHADLSAAYPPPVANSFNIGMLHTCLEDGADYAPTCLDNLYRRGYNYWALGHTHERAEWEHDGMRIVYPGNPQGRSVRETGPKGCTLVTVDDDLNTATEFIELDSVRWLKLAFEADDQTLESRGAESLCMALHENDGRLLAVRLAVTGDIAGDERSVRERLAAVAVNLSPDIWIERVEVGRLSDESTTTPIDPELKKVLTELTKDQASLGELAKDLDSFRTALPDEVELRTWTEPDAINQLATVEMGEL